MIRENEKYKHVYERLENARAFNLLGTQLEKVEKGKSTLILPFNIDICNHSGFLHGGILTTVSDIAGGWALLSLGQESTVVVTVEIKMNFLFPVKEDVRVTGEVIKSGKHLGVSSLVVETMNNKKVAVGIGTYHTKN